MCSVFEPVWTGVDASHPIRPVSRGRSRRAVPVPQASPTPGSWSDPAALGDADLTVGPFWLDGPHRGVFVRTLNGFSVVSGLPRALNPLVA